MEQETMRRLVVAARVGRLATTGRNAPVHLVPFCFVLSGSSLYSAVDEKPKRSRTLRRLDNIRANPAVTVLVDHYEEDWTKLWWVRLEGSARILDPGEEEELHARQLLADKYRQYRAQPPAGPLLAIDVGRWTGWEAALISS
jgi:PPOX class probable F420-dependent enzyme